MMALTAKEVLFALPPRRPAVNLTSGYQGENHSPQAAT